MFRGGIVMHHIKSAWLISASVIALCAACARASSDRNVTVMPPSTPGRSAITFNRAKLGTVERDITYCTADSVPLKLDVHYPKMMNGPAPVAVWVHGGGWTSGSKLGGTGFADVPELVSRGYLVVSVDYRLAPQYKWPAQIQDVKCAIRFLRANAARFNLEPNKMGAWGGSAGGHLVALLGTADASAGFEGSGGYEDQSSRIQAVVDMFGPADLPQLFRGFTGGIVSQVFGNVNGTDILQRASPTTFATQDDPPFLILQGDRDTVVPPSQSQTLYERIKAAGIPATLVMVKNAEHSFDPAGGDISPSRAELTQMIADFFDQNLR
jgi:acetyl esterase/lipase